MTSIQPDYLNLEEFVQEHGDAAKPKARTYLFAVNCEHFASECECMTGGEILRLAEKDPATTKLVQVNCNGDFKRIGADDKVCFTDPGIERFVTVRSVCRDGGAA